MWALVIFVMSAISANAMPEIGIEHLDKAIHFGQFIIFALLLSHAFKYGKVTPINNLLFTLILAGGYGILMELAQLYIPGRSASIYDFGADLAGVVAGLILTKAVLYGRNKTF